jgi:iron complex outermembrane recepter protein
MKNGFLATAGLAILAPCLVTPAMAQTANDESEQARGDEIVVTAQRREQGLLEVPLSISAATSEDLLASGVRDVSDLQFTTPGLIPNNGAGYVQLFIRGVGNTIFVGADPSVTTFIDDVPRIYGSMVNDFVNVERVEVLKGAQGGLYGRNATGGVVNIITRKPDPTEFAGEVQALYGTKETFQLSGYLNLPLAEGLAMNVSGQRGSHDGYIKNALKTTTPYTAAMFPNGSAIGTPQQTADFFNSAVKPPKSIGFKDFWAVEGKIRYESEAFDITLAADYTKKADDSGNEYDNIDAERNARGLSQFILGTFGIDAVLPPNFYLRTDEKFETARSERGAADITDYGISATATLHLDSLDITSITAWRKNETFYRDDQAGVAPTILNINVTSEKEFFYQEIRALSTTDGPLQYLVGASYLDTDVAGDSYIIYYPPLFQTTPTTSTGGVRNWSVYAQLGYDLTDDLNLTVSGRYINEKNSVTYSSPVVATTRVSADKFLPSATLSYGLAGGGNVYARYAKGFKAGGVNTVDPPTAYPTDFGKVFAPEQVDTFEIGVRTPLADRRAQFTAAAFYNDYKGLQTFTAGNAANPGIVFAVVNAGSARTYGAEATFSYKVTDTFDLGLNAGYLNARYKTFANTDGSVLNTFDFSGARMLFSPEWQFSLTGQLDQPVTDTMNLTGSFLVSYTDDVKFFNSSAPGVPDPVQEAFVLVNARAGVSFDDDRFRLSLFANNLFNRAYYTSGNAGGFGRQLRWGTPRIVGVEGRVSF